VKIEANLEGFLNYFTAQNIRFKLRHPVFLALKFHKSVCLFYNRTIYPFATQKKLVLKLQRLLLNGDQKCASSSKSVPTMVEERPTRRNQPHRQAKEDCSFICLVDFAGYQ